MTENTRPVDTIVVSDLHLGEGRRPRTGAFARMEDFFWDEEWLRFCRHLLERARDDDHGVRLVLNGDCFDLLQMVRPYDGPLRCKRTERVFGAGTAPEKAAWKLTHILTGHERFVAGLGELHAAGHEIVIVTGNHDAELFWPEVQAVMREYIEAASSAAAAGDTPGPGTLRFVQWFLIVDGQVWIEHGHKYDEINSFRFQLDPVLPSTAGYPDDRLLRLPIGSLFARYLFNPIDNRYPLADNMGDDSTAFVWAVRNHPLSSGRLMIAYGLSFLRVLRKQKLFLPREIGAIRSRHRESRETLAAEHGLSPAALARVDGLQHNLPGGGYLGFMIRIMLKVLRQGLLPFAMLVGAIFLLLLLHTAVLAVVPGPLLQTAVLVFSYLVILASAFVVTLFIGRRRPFLRRRQADPYHTAAQAIARQTGVRYVTFGHSHLLDAAELGSDGLYCNTGTWTSLFHEEYMPLRPLVDFTFFEYRDGVGGLRRWNDSRGRIEPARVLERARSGFPLEDLDEKEGIL